MKEKNKARLAYIIEKGAIPIILAIIYIIGIPIVLAIIFNLRNSYPVERINCETLYEKRQQISDNFPSLLTMTDVNISKEGEEFVVAIRGKEAPLVCKYDLNCKLVSSKLKDERWFGKTEIFIYVIDFALTAFAFVIIFAIIYFIVKKEELSDTVIRKLKLND